MDRREMLRLALAAPFVAGVAAAAPSGRVRPGGPGWPSEGEWRGLRSHLDGDLIRPRPLLGPCLTDPASAACKDRLANLRNPFFLGEQASGTQVSGYLDAWTPADSAWVVAARSVRDVAQAVRFARRHDLRLVVKGGGHSYHGASNAPDSLLIWTRPMRAVTVRDNFLPAGAGAGATPVAAVTAEAGAVWLDLYDAVTTKAGRYVQGGGCVSVGVAGHVQSGGFGSFSKAFGLSSSNLLEAEVVTADGEIRIANPWQEPDLFWALKGGGGGSLGVVTRLTLKTHDLPAQFGGAGGVIRAASDAAFAALVRRFLDLYAEALFNPHWGEQVEIRPDNTLKISMACQGLDAAAAQAPWRAFADWVKADPAAYAVAEPLEAGVIAARDEWDVASRRARGSKAMRYDDRPGAPTNQGWWAGDQDQVSAFLHGYESLWLPAELLREGQRDRLAAGLVAASRHFAVGLHFNKGLAGAPPAVIAAARDTAMNPDVLGAFALAIVATGGPPPALAFAGLDADLPGARRHAAAIAAAAAELRALAPAAGAYLAECSYFQKDWGAAFWGANQARLAAVKAKYDPEGLFVVHHGVGSEAWSADGFTRLA